MVLHVTNSPFNEEQVELLNRLMPTLNDIQRIWLTGYLSASAAGVTLTNASAAESVLPVSAPAVPAPVLSKEVTVLYGSQTGNSSNLAKKLTAQLQNEGFEVTLTSMGDFKSNALKKVQNLLILVSTHGEGEPPDHAIAFYEFLHSKRAPKLEELRYSVLALGDTSYEFFCQTGKDFDKRLEELGAKRLADRADCDVDFDEPAAEWMKQVLTALGENPAAAANAAAEAVSSSDTAVSEYSRSNPFHAEVLENLNLNGRGSDRETRHVELSLEGSNLTYEPGDSLGIYPENHPRLVEELIEAFGWNGEELVTVNKDGQKQTIREALTRQYEITILTKPLVEQLAQLTGNAGLQELVGAGHDQLRAYLQGHDLLDLVQDYSLIGIPAQEFISKLRKIPARLYSIASSPLAFPEEVHLTVRAVRYDHKQRERYGVCSVQLAERVSAGDKLPVFIQNNPSFKLPADSSAKIIMIGPGTGVAPFRAFIGEREEQGASGESWLFYGDQHFSTDFLYQTEWQRWLKDGVLTRMDVAFSRDTEEKIYVQHRMLENSKDLYQWIQDGAYIYVCGDESKMAHDVHAALGTILEQEGGMSPEQASEYLTELMQNKRYQRDVY
ncbi:assimilatory sulfite reductase (NADPH) flavoprotein subunit [Paenibacillus sp. JX-17]|uniref:Assimilatory sulfite reductase (NADPH) flavoprotein subunit n=1 Tax=Paenibacillus lacisoli TaxID=3064525 RepID=A0ABT9CEL5_9BACL|nr:assimilatory sulfite reductase (NADPH) flavoprotein subunit [Paenibacillus sp. JX-17]MDO7907714.1 assimilatory sulfite reductase (NADPH) flavoprotein subunit [Paenibacillus sp. JX-17]